MTASEFGQALTGLIGKAEDNLTEGVRTHQNRVARFVIRELQSLTTNQAGRIRPSAANRRRIARIRREMRKLVNSDKFYDEIKRFQRSFEAVQGISYEYFQEGFSEFAPDALYEDLRDLASEEVLNNITVSGANEGLVRPVEEVLNQATRGGASREDLEETLRREVQTHFKEKDGAQVVETVGKLERYTKLYARDALNQYARNLNQAVTESLGLEWYLYAGGRVDDTRDFCLKRYGKYWHRSEVEEWGKIQSWQGRRPGTNSTTIFQNLGGYNCLHQLIPVSTSIIPDSVQQRIDR